MHRTAFDNQSVAKSRFWQRVITKYQMTVAFIVILYGSVANITVYTLMNDSPSGAIARVTNQT